MTAPDPELANLRDAHVHLYLHGAELSMLDLSACQSKNECLERIAVFSANKGPNEWVRSAKARVEGWRKPLWPTAAELNDAAGGRPCVIRSFDQHAAIASSHALTLAGITSATPDPPRGIIARDPSTGEPTGLLLEEAWAILKHAIPAPTRAQRKERLRVAATDLAARGYVEVHDMLSEEWMFELLAELADEDDLPLRVWLYAPMDAIVDLLAREEECARPNVHLAGAKLFTDGTLNSRTANMLFPYAHPLPDAPTGKALMSQGEIEKAVRICDELGVPAAMHAIGDAAVRNCLNAIERTAPTVQGFRIEHCQFIDEADIPRFAQLSVIASPQPCHLLTDIEALRRLTPDRLDRAFPLRELADSITSDGWEIDDLLWLGTDTPVVDPRPEDNIQAAVERRRADMPTDQAIAPAQALTRDETIRCMRAPDFNDIELDVQVNEEGASRSASPEKS